MCGVCGGGSGCGGGLWGGARTTHAAPPSSIPCPPHQLRTLTLTPPHPPHPLGQVPPNTALVVCREKGGLLNVLLSPLCPSGAHPRQAEVSRCLEAVTRASGLTAEAPLAGRGHSRTNRGGGGSGGGWGANGGVAAAGGKNGGAHGGGANGSAGANGSTLARGGGGSQALPPSESGDGVVVGGWGGAASGGAGAEALAREGSLRHGLGGSGSGLDALPLTVRGEEHRLTGHSGAVMCCAAAGGLLFTGSTDSTIRVGARVGGWVGGVGGGGWIGGEGGEGCGAAVLARCLWERACPAPPPPPPPCAPTPPGLVSGLLLMRGHPERAP